MSERILDNTGKRSPRTTSTDRFCSLSAQDRDCRRIRWRCCDSPRSLVPRRRPGSSPVRLRPRRPRREAVRDIRRQRGVCDVRDGKDCGDGRSLTQPGASWTDVCVSQLNTLGLQGLRRPLSRRTRQTLHRFIASSRSCASSETLSITATGSPTSSSATPAITDPGAPGPCAKRSRR